MMSEEVHNCLAELDHTGFCTGLRVFYVEVEAVDDGQTEEVSRDSMSASGSGLSGVKQLVFGQIAAVPLAGLGDHNDA